MNAGDVAAAAGYTATITGEIRDTLKSEALPACEIAERIGRPVSLVVAVLRVMKHGGLVVDGPGPDGGITRWARTR